MPPLSTETGSAQENKQTRRYQKFHVRAECRKKARNGHGSDYVRPTSMSFALDYNALMTANESFGSHASDWRALPSPISMRRAKNHLCREPALTDPKVSSALARIKEVISSDTPVMWDLVIKMFDDLDLVYFHGHLGYRVLLQWAGFGESPTIFAADRSLSNIGLTVPPDTYPNAHPRTMISIASSSLEYGEAQGTPDQEAEGTTRWSTENLPASQLSGLLQKRLGLASTEKIRPAQVETMLEKVDTQAMVYDTHRPWRLNFLARGLPGADVTGQINRKRQSRVVASEKYDRERPFHNFTRLPADVRKRIYLLHFEDLLSGVQAFNHPVTPPLARAGRAIRWEFLQLFWSTQTFHITSMPVLGPRAAELSETDTKWLRNVVGNHMPKLRNFVVSCLSDRSSTRAPLVKVKFNQKITEVSVEHLGTWKALMWRPYGLWLSKSPERWAQEYLQERSQMMRTKEGLVMNELLLQALVERVGAVRHGVPTPAPRSIPVIKQEVIKIED
ncbi:hypothetical protein Slin15195_G110830 [Septoria linicola]|uniref:Uncharacterized protein n=1 Tax=Septoria linicola TaxID=215465 RepID=A0A9Q9EPK0_9PEZI|nr:hypothetical protein Slin15195_G110830 [Septoria linicola]